MAHGEIGVSARIKTWSASAARDLIHGVGVFVLNGLRFNPLAINMAVAFASPLIITALVGPFLGELIGWRRWSAVLVGFFGVLIIVEPFYDSVNVYVLLPLGAAFTSACTDIVTRRLSDTESALSVLLCSTVLVMLVAVCFGFAGNWGLPRLMDFALLMLTGLLSGAAHYLLIETFVLAEAVIVDPFRYSTLIWGLLIGFFVWDHLPSGLSWSGICLIIGSGIYIIHRDSRRREAE